MSSDEAARLAATIEVLTGAVHFLLAERVAAQPEAAQGALLHILQRAFSPPRSETARAGPSRADLALWMPIVAAGMMQEVARQVERAPAGPVHRGPPSEVAERPCREHARGALSHFERGRAVA